MTGGIYCSEFETMKAPHIMRRRVSYMSNGEIGDDRRSAARVFAKKKKLLEKCFGKTNECYVDVSKCNLPFCGSSKELLKDNKSNFLSIILQLLAKYDTVLDKLLLLPKGSPKYFSLLIQNEAISVLAEEVPRDIKRTTKRFFFCHYS